MKKTLCTVAVSFLGMLAFAQAPAMEWQKSLGGNGNDQASSIKQTADGGYILAGTTSTDNDGHVSMNHGNFDFWVVKTSASGTIEWQKTLGGSENDYANKVIQTADGGYVVVGMTNSGDFDVIGYHGGSDAWIVKLDSDGDVEWKRTYGGSGPDYASDILQHADGGYIVCGQTGSQDGNMGTNIGDGDVLLMKLDADGLIEWQRGFGGSSHEYASSVKATTDGGYVLSGMASSTDGDVTNNHGMHDLWILKTTANGTLQWQTAMGGSGTDSANHVCQLSDGSYIAAGSVFSNDGQITTHHGVSDIWVVKLNAGGTLIWQKTYGGSSNEGGTHIIQNTDNTFTILGVTRSSDGDVVGHHDNYWDSMDGWIFKINPAGDIIWQKTLGGNDNEAFSEMQPTSDGGYAIGGYAVSNNGDVTESFGIADFWLVKLAPEALSNVDFTENNFSVYPNPAASLLQLHLPDGMRIDKITITDSLGKLLLQNTEDFTTVNVENLSAGTYFIQVFSVDKTFQTKFIKQ